MSADGNKNQLSATSYEAAACCCLRALLLPDKPTDPRQPAAGRRAASKAATCGHIRAAKSALADITGKLWFRCGAFITAGSVGRRQVGPVPQHLAHQLYVFNYRTPGAARGRAITADLLRQTQKHSAGTSGSSLDSQIEKPW